MLRLFAHTPERVLPAPTAKLSEAHWPVPFRQGLEYSPPTRGPWTIVHVGMLVPECHEIFVCAQGCLRGVVLSAAELGLQRRFSTITVTEEHLRDGQLEDTIIEGVTHILERLPKLPPAVLVYSSCLHHFSGADLGWAYRKLSEAFPDAPQERDAARQQDAQAALPRPQARRPSQGRPACGGLPRGLRPRE